MSRDRKPEGSYEVGYGKPPTHTRFKPGQSGNPKGRRKGVRNLKSVLEEELFRPVAISEGSKRRNVSVLTLVIRQSLAKAAKCDTRSLTQHNKLVQRAGLSGGAEIAEPVAQMPLSAAEEAMLREALAELKVDALEGEALP